MEKEVKKEGETSGPSLQQLQHIIDMRWDVWEEAKNNSNWTQEEENEKYKLFVEECKEIAKNWEFFEDYDIDYEQIKVDFNKDYFQENDIKEVRKEAVDEKKQSLKYDFISHITNFSYKNDIAIELIFHCSLSVILKELKITLNNKNISPKLHMNWQQECLQQDTKVRTDNGKIRLRDLPENFLVESYNFSTGNKELKKAIKSNPEIKEVYNMRLSDGRSVKCSAEHTFFVKDGDKVIEKKLKDIKEDDLLLVDNRYDEDYMKKFKTPFTKGHKPWNTGLSSKQQPFYGKKSNFKNKTLEENYGKEKAKEIKNKISKTIKKGNYIAWNKNKKCPQISNSLKGNPKLCGKNNSSYGKVYYPSRIYIKELDLKVKSLWEKEVALKLFNNDLIVNYESDTFKLKNTTYTPDFKLNNDTYIEVKGFLFNNNTDKYKEFLNTYNKKLIFLASNNTLKELKSNNFVAYDIFKNWFDEVKNEICSN